MEINLSTVEQVIVVELIGEIDAESAPLIENEVLPNVQPGDPVLLYMEGVTFMSSAGLRGMLMLYRHVVDQGGRIVVVGLSQELHDIMVATGFYNYFAAYPTFDEGMAALYS